MWNQAYHLQHVRACLVSLHWLSLLMSATACRGLMCMWLVLQELGTASAAPLPCCLALTTSTPGKRIRWWVFLSVLCLNTHCVCHVCQNYCGYELCPSSSIVKPRERNISERAKVPSRVSPVTWGWRKFRAIFFEMLCRLVFRILDDGQSPRTQ
jgi:hypothetical protein